MNPFTLSTPSPAPFDIGKHGDAAERRYWWLFIAAQFPSYEAFWQSHVTPLTQRTPDEPDKVGQAKAEASRRRRRLGLRGVELTPDSLVVQRVP